MSLPAPPPHVVAELARRSGCRIVERGALMNGEPFQRLACAGHAAKLRLLANLAEWEARNLPDVRRVAERVVTGQPNPWSQACALHAFVRDHVTFTTEPIETFTATLITLAHGLGDCDDSARALLALLRSVGLPGGLLTLPDASTGRPPTHVAAGVQLGGGWKWLETSIEAEPGEHPIAAAKRLGIRTRADIL